MTEGKTRLEIEQGKNNNMNNTSNEF